MSESNEQPQDTPGTGPDYNTVAQPAPEPVVGDTPPLGDVVQAEPAPQPEPPAEKPRLALNVILEKDFRGQKDKDSDYQEAISLLRVTAEDFNRYSEDYAKINIQKDPEARKWFTSVREGRELAMIGGAFLEALKRDGSEWTQSVTHEGQRILPGRPQLGASSDGQKLTGQRAVLKMQAALGIGSMIQVPLWHSGVWVSINAPSDGALLNLERRIGEEKINLGRMTNGLIYSHSSVYIVNHLMTLLLDNIYETSIKDFRSETLFDLIKVTDLPILVWGLACSIYPNGYDYKLPCVKHPDKCKHITEEKLNLGRLFFFDHKGVTLEQRKHMANRTKKYTAEEIQHYHTLGKGGDGRVVKINDDISFVLKVPTVKDYIRSGYTWIESIEKMVAEVLTGRPTDKDKDDFITQQSVVTLFRQYAHWVSRIIFRDNETVEDTETIEEVLSMLSSDQKLYDKFFDEVKKFIDDSTVAMIALPSYDCPACGTPMTPEESKHPHLIPLEVISVFFTLVHRRLDRTRM